MKHMSKESTAVVYLIDVSPKHVINGSVVASVRCGETLIFFLGLFESLFVRESILSAAASPKTLVFFNGAAVAPFSFFTNLLKFLRVNLGALVPLFTVDDAPPPDPDAFATFVEVPGSGHAFSVV